MARKNKPKKKSEALEPASVNNKAKSNQKPGLYQLVFSGKEFYYLLGVLFLVCFFVFKDFIYLKKVYLFRDIGSDSITTFFPSLAGHSDYLKKEGIPGWSFAQGMGQNVFPIWLGDFFSNFLTLFDKAKIPYGIAYMEIVKIMLAGILFFKFLKEVRVSDFSALIFASLYAFSGFMIVGGTWTIFSVEAVYVAIVLYGFERWLNHQKYFWFVLGIACLGFFHPFLLFPYSLFLMAYIFARYFDVHQKLDKNFFVFVLKTIGLATFGVAISCYQLLPDVLQYLESPRVGGESSFFAKLQQQSVFGLATSDLRFTTTFRAFGSDMLGNGNKFKGWQNYLEAPLFYCGLICLVTVPQFFLSLSKKQKIIYGSIALLFLTPVFFPYFRYAFWAFSGDYFRTFSLLIVLFLLLFSARALSFIEREKKLNKIVLAITVLFLLFLLYTPDDLFAHAVNKHLRSVSTFLILSYAALLLGLNGNVNMKSLSKIGLFLFCFFEIIYFSNISVNQREVVTAKMLNDKIGYNDYTVESVAYLKNRDSGFYRINKDYSSGLAMHSSLNDAKVQGYYGTSSYYSFNQKNYIKFLGDLDVINVKNENDTRWARGLGGRPVLFSIASGKYWLSKRPDNAIAGMGFDSIAKFGDVKVYKNRYALPFGFTYAKIIGEDDFKKISTAQKDFCLLRACVIGNEDQKVFSSFETFSLSDTLQALTFDNYLNYTTELKKDTFSISKFSENNIIGSVSVSQPRVLFFSMPFDEGWSVKVNNKDATLYRINAGLTGLMLDTGSNDVVLNFEPRLKNTGSIVSIISLLAFAGLLSFQKLKKKKDEV